MLIRWDRLERQRLFSSVILSLSFLAEKQRKRMGGEEREKPATVLETCPIGSCVCVRRGTTGEQGRVTSKRWGLANQ